MNRLSGPRHLCYWPMQTNLRRPCARGTATVPLVAVALFAALLCGSAARADTIAQAAPIAPADFGAPPSGEIPILYNDHTVYATPDILKQARVLAALVKDGQIYIPLR